MCTTLMCSRTIAYFVKETLECLHRMAELLQCQAAQFSHAGTKDRRAVSVQRMSIRGVTAARSEREGEGARSFLIWGGAIYCHC